MESSTADVCEWCNRPMLPSGATVSGRAAKDLKKNGGPITVPPKPAVGVETGVPLGQAMPQETTEETTGTEQAEPEAEQEVPDVLLRPLGHAGGEQVSPAPPPPPPQPQAPARTGMPSHGLADEATKTSVDISQYMGKDESIFRPIERDAEYVSASSLDRVTRKGKLLDQSGSGPALSEGQRIGRCAIAGLAISVVLSIVQFVVTGKAVETLYVFRLGRGPSLMTAVVYGIATGLVLGPLLGALLTRQRWGPVAGLLGGLLVSIGFHNPGWAQAAGAITGILVGRFATQGVRRVVNV